MEIKAIFKQEKSNVSFIRYKETHLLGPLYLSPNPPSRYFPKQAEKPHSPSVMKIIPLECLMIKKF